jgi:tRNA threonylcarbamoyladenosine biosynthesis protein TsaE
MDFRYTSRSVNDTLRIAQDLESEKFPNMVICLYGELGSGKTVFTKGFASAMEIDETITSPTFNIIKEYTTGELPLYHMDVYRLNEDDDTIGIKDYFNKGGVTIIEWADVIKNKLPEKRLDIKFKVIDEDTRVLVFMPHGEEYEEICSAVL